MVIYGLVQDAVAVPLQKLPSIALQVEKQDHLLRSRIPLQARLVSAQEKFATILPPDLKAIHISAPRQTKIVSLPSRVAGIRSVSPNTKLHLC